MAQRRVDRIGDPWGTRTPYARGEAWPVRVDMHLEEGADPDSELIVTAADCHAQILRGLKWTVTRLKTAAPQVLTG